MGRSLRAAAGRVSSHLLVVNHEWADSFGTPFPECELPHRIIALLNADQRRIDRTEKLEAVAAALIETVSESGELNVRTAEYSLREIRNMAVAALNESEAK